MEPLFEDYIRNVEVHDGQYGHHAGQLARCYSGLFANIDISVFIKNMYKEFNFYNELDHQLLRVFCFSHSSICYNNGAMGEQLAGPAGSLK